MDYFICHVSASHDTSITICPYRYETDYNILFVYHASFPFSNAHVHLCCIHDIYRQPVNKFENKSKMFLTVVASYFSKQYQPRYSAESTVFSLWIKKAMKYFSHMNSVNSFSSVIDKLHMNGRDQGCFQAKVAINLVGYSNSLATSDFLIIVHNSCLRPITGHCDNSVLIPSKLGFYAARRGTFTSHHANLAEIKSIVTDLDTCNQLINSK